ncbi:hypothetical protein, partial [Sphingomonas sp.]|uniref:hypothetical protein n=1 Tax=Sphingomonas sp. TaxID=28214 RepID=UPI003F70D93F
SSFGGVVGAALLDASSFDLGPDMFAPIPGMSSMRWDALLWAIAETVKLRTKDAIATATLLRASLS